MITDANRKWWILVAAGLSLAIISLDEIFIGVALPTIRDELGISQLGAQWVVNSYVLGLTAFVAAGGRLGDLLGHGRMFVTGAAILFVGTIAAGFADSGGWLIASRAIQGVGTATMLSLGIAMVGLVFAEKERGQAVGIYGLLASGPAAIAPFVGGALTDLVSWRWIFFITLPLIAVVITIVVVGWRQPERAPERSSFDTRGLGLLLLSIVPLVLALMQAPDWGWGSSPVITLLAVAAISLSLFIRAETRVSHPLIDLRLLQQPAILGADLVIFAAQFTKLAVLVFGALFLQDQLGMSPLLAGTALLAALIPVMLTAVLSGRLTDRYGARLPTLAGIIGTGVALAWIALATLGESYVLLIPGLMLWGLALPFVFNPPYTAVLNAVVAEKRGQASGVATTGRQLGGVLAVAVLGAVLIGSDDYALVFGLAAGVTFAVGVAAYLLIEPPWASRPVAPTPAESAAS